MKTEIAGIKPEIARQIKFDLLRDMLRIRRFEEKSAELYSLGKIRGFLHLYIGEEAIAVGAMRVLKPEDSIVATYREHGHALARGISMGSVMAEMFGKANGCSRGRGGSMHLFDASLNFYGGYAIVGGGLPIAVGLALAARMQKTNSVTACFFGDGAVAEGEFHESMNLAGLWQLPVVFLCENNLYAMGTALERHQSQTNIAKKAESYGIKSETVDGMDVLAVEEATGKAIELVRVTSRPYLIEYRTDRVRAHSMYDAELYRNKDEVDLWKIRCPILGLIASMKEDGILNDNGLSEIEKSVAQEIDQAVEYAEAGKWEPLEDLTKFVYTETLNYKP